MDDVKSADYDVIVFEREVENEIAHKLHYVPRDMVSHCNISHSIPLDYATPQYCTLE